MGSRIRENVKHLFQCFCEVVAPQSVEKDPWIIQKFPDSYKDEEVLKSVPKFAYPCDFQNTVVQHYSFVLTSIDSKWTFGFCRHDPKTETALVVLSYLPWHESFYRLLNHIAEITHGQKTDELWNFLEAVYQSKVPDPGTTIEIPFDQGQAKFVCQSPSQFQLPSIPENRNLTEYYNAVDAHNMMVVFASMLYERRIIFKSKKLYRLSACVQSANAIIYPMNWQHIFIPVLPMALMDYLFAPMPYLIGVPEPIYDRIRKTELGDVVVLDADKNTIETPFQDLESLPTDVVGSLKRQLRNRAALLGDGVSRAFLRTLVQLIGGYRDALRFHQGQRITFNEEAFVESRPSSMQPFLRQMLQLQIFQQFIDERLEMLNNGLGFSDEFEMEACNYSDKSSSKLKHQYKEWTYTMKKEGSAFFKTVRNKANPAMKSAVKSVKEKGKDVRTAYKGMRSKWKESVPRGTMMPISRDAGDKPRSAPTSPTHKRRPQTVALPKTSLTVAATYRRGPSRSLKGSSPLDRSKPYSPLSPSSDPSSPEAAADTSSDTPGLHLSPLDMDLLGELKDVIYPKEKAESPPVDRTLKPVRSLESFQPTSGGSVPDGWWLQSVATASPPHSFLLSTPPVAPHRTRHGPTVGVPDHPKLTRTNHSTKSIPQEFTVKELTSLNHSPQSTVSSNALSSSTPNIIISSRSTTPSFVPFPAQFSPDSPTNSKDLFGATPFVVSGDTGDGDSVFVVSSPSSVDLVRLPPPVQHSSRSSKHAGETDLIRLDSTPDEEFDPILAKDKESSQHPVPSASQARTSLSPDQGMSNPLYPYFIPTIGPTSTVRPLAASSNASYSTPSYRRQNYNVQDLALLQEYGLDFKNLSLHNGSSHLVPSPSPSYLQRKLVSSPVQSQPPTSQDPFKSLTVFDKEPLQQQPAPKQWTKFE